MFRVFFLLAIKGRKRPVRNFASGDFVVLSRGEVYSSSCTTTSDATEFPGVS